MPIEILIALTGFSLVASITPGPNNIMILTSGVNFGFRRTIPHMLGIIGGFGCLLTCVGFGMAKVLEILPSLFTAIKFAGGAYLVYLAYKIATSGPIASGEEGGAPLTFIQAAAFQWVNPKAWVMGLTAMTTYAAQATPYMLGVLLVVLAFVSVSFLSISVWCGFGVALREWLSDPKRLRIFNALMALLLIASLWPMLR